MFTKFALPLFIAAGAVARPAVMRRDTTIPPLSQWQSSGLESYWTFKVRYTSLGCAEQQGSDYYNECCYPFAANTTVSSDCTPSSLVCAGVNPYDPSASLTTTSSSVAAAPTPAPTDDSANDQTTPANTGSDEDDYDESNLPYCEDPNDDGYYTDDSDSETSYTDQSYTPPADNQQASPSSSADNSQSTPDSSGSNDNSGSTDNSGSNDNTGSTDNTSSNTSSTSGDIGNAFATFYYQNGNAGACGNYHSDSDYIGAIDQAWYGDLGQVSQYCGRSVTITNTNNGKQVTITVADVCPTCDTDNSFDLSYGAFTAIASEADGEVPITWHFN